MKDLQGLVDLLKIQVIAEEYAIIPPTERNTASRYRAALAILREEGYMTYYVHVMYGREPKTRKILVSPGVSYHEVYENLSKIDQ